MKEKLMLMGIISLLLVVFQGALQKICIPESYTHHMRSCKSKDLTGKGGEVGAVRGTAHYRTDFFASIVGGGHRFLADGGSGTEHCAKKGQVPLLSIEAIHQLHIFIFVLATTHVILGVLTMLLGRSGVDSPISEMEADVTLLPIVPSAQVDKNQNSITIEELPSRPEIGSSSSTPVVSKASKNKMKNYLRRVRKKVVKARKTAEVKALKHVKSKANKKFVAPSTNPFPGGSHFHPSHVTQWREVVETRAQSSIHLLNYYMTRINQAKTEQTPAPGPRPPIEGYDPSTLLDDVRSRFYTCPTTSTREEEV
ncbi:hypothetical protein IEQ34_006727 [Dendrobium chrysotoxum]|uniref:Uncharacterized protein n=1 Tax=Dendrobium chrysotoxum TaxID=161865 RepID=A0AAV7H603_DENCH|nr:hypothetical protein IEQ34_006727 [Dendrobium chrysotoxum]